MFVKTLNANVLDTIGDGNYWAGTVSQHCHFFVIIVTKAYLPYHFLICLFSSSDL